MLMRIKQHTFFIVKRQKTCTWKSGTYKMLFPKAILKVLIRDLFKKIQFSQLNIYAVKYVP